VLRRVVVVEARGVRYLGSEVLEQVMLVVEGPYQTAFGKKEAVSAASCQSVGVVSVSRLYSRPKSPQV
jgi:hypothetical protein